jgi:hypothetical protein
LPGRSVFDRLRHESPAAKVSDRVDPATTGAIPAAGAAKPPSPTPDPAAPAAPAAEAARPARQAAPPAPLDLLFRPQN